MNGRTIDEPLLSHHFAGEQVWSMRRLVAKCSAGAGLSDARCQDFVLAVDEILTNAIRHGGGSGRLELWLADGCIWFKVTDWGPGLKTPPSWTQPGPTLLGGRGLWIARQTTDRLTLDSGPRGTVVVGAMELLAAPV